jgi:hypothetical protein
MRRMRVGGGMKGMTRTKSEREILRPISGERAFFRGDDGMFGHRNLQESETGDIWILSSASDPGSSFGRFPTGI